MMFLVPTLALATLTATAAPSASPTPPPAPPAVQSKIASPAKANPKATPAPPKETDENRVGISGVWEVAIQGPTGVQYTHFKLTQTGTVLTGQYLDGNGKKFPVTGTLDGKNVRLIVTMPDTSPLMFTGTEDGGTDMVGTLDNSKDVIGFTAAYRPKYKWIDNLTPGTGGLGNPGGVPQ